MRLFVCVCEKKGARELKGMNNSFLPHPLTDKASMVKLVADLDEPGFVDIKSQ